MVSTGPEGDLQRLQASGQTRLLVGRGVLLHDALGGGFVKLAHDVFVHRGGAFFVPSFDRSIEAAQIGLQFGALGLVADAPCFILTDAFDLALNVGHRDTPLTAAPVWGAGVSTGSAVTD